MGDDQEFCFVHAGFEMSVRHQMAVGYMSIRKHAWVQDRCLGWRYAYGSCQHMVCI